MSAAVLDDMAEFGWGLSDELLHKSRTELGEEQCRRSEDIADVKEQIETRPDISKQSNVLYIIFITCLINADKYVVKLYHAY